MLRQEDSKFDSRQKYSFHHDPCYVQVLETLEEPTHFMIWRHSRNIAFSEPENEPLLKRDFPMLASQCGTPQIPGIVIERAS